MKIVFVSNYYNHHQAPISNSFFERTHHQYLFIETEKMDEERIQLGWGGTLKPDYVAYYGDDEGTKKRCEKAVFDADAVIIGSAPEFLIKKRLEAGKLVFRYSERPLKKGFELYKYPYRFIKWHMANRKRYNVYMLCASAYTASDYAKFGLFKNRCFKWGYFPEVKHYSDIERIIENKQKNSILWVARFLDWKHPEIPVILAKHLKDDGYAFTLKMIGVGPEKEKTERLANDLGLLDEIQFLGSMSPDDVRKHMEESKIFVFTSDRNEGWGAVLNEAMNSGCAVVANKAIGSVPYLINDGANGFTYNGSLDELYSKTKCLLDRADMAKAFGLKAYETMIETWNAETAAKRFISLCESLLTEDNIIYTELGPCSRADMIGR